MGGATAGTSVLVNRVVRSATEISGSRNVNEIRQECCGRCL